MVPSRTAIHRLDRTRSALAPRPFPDHGHENDGSVRFVAPIRLGSALDHEQVLLPAAADRDDEPAADRELLAELGWHLRRGRGHDDPVPGRASRIAPTAVAGSHLDALDPE